MVDLDSCWVITLVICSSGSVTPLIYECFSLNQLFISRLKLKHAQEGGTDYD